MFKLTPEYSELVARLVNSLDPADEKRGYIIEVCETIAAQLDNLVLFEALVDAAESRAHSSELVHSLEAERFGAVASRG